MILDVIVPLLNLSGLYLAIGMVFALAFAFSGAARLDSDATEGSIGFRLLIIPGATALWPLLAYRWLQAERRPTRARPADEGAPVHQVIEPAISHVVPDLRDQLRRPSDVRRRQGFIALTTLPLLPLLLTLAILSRPASGPPETIAALEDFEVQRPLTIGAPVHEFSLRVEAVSVLYEGAGTGIVDGSIFYAKDRPEGRILRLSPPESGSLILGPDALVYWQQESGASLRDSAWLLGRFVPEGSVSLMLPPPALDEDGQILIVNGLDGAILGRSALSSQGIQ